MSTLNKIYSVSAVAQSKTMSCWAAAAAMLLSWKGGVPISERQAAKQAGATFEGAFNANAGLPGSEIAVFAKALKLRVEVPTNYKPAGYYNLLVAHGPLWIGTAIFNPTIVYRHVRIVRASWEMGE